MNTLRFAPARNDLQKLVPGVLPGLLAPLALPLFQMTLPLRFLLTPTDLFGKFALLHPLRHQGRRCADCANDGVEPFSQVAGLALAPGFGPVGQRIGRIGLQTEPSRREGMLGRPGPVWPSVPGPVSLGLLKRQVLAVDVTRLLRFCQLEQRQANGNGPNENDRWLRRRPQRGIAMFGGLARVLAHIHPDPTIDAVAG